MPDARLRDIATLKFIDQEAGEDGVAIVRAATGQMALALSLRAGSDTEVFLTLAAAEELADAINRALVVARAG